VPLSTLTHALGGGAGWPEVGDWEVVTGDLLQLIRDGDCDALSLGLPDIARALVCSGPDCQVRAYDPRAGRYQAYGLADRIEVLIEVGKQLAWAEAGCTLWPGDGLLAPTNPEETRGGVPSQDTSQQPARSAQTAYASNPRLGSVRLTVVAASHPVPHREPGGGGRFRSGAHCGGA
jgi:hypothetical protein